MLPNQNKKNFTPINHQIRAQKVLCIDHLNNNLGEINISEAIRIAIDNGLDLVQVSEGKSRVPTCKILDYGKFKYQESKNQKAAAKKQRDNLVKVKEIKFRPNTDINDLRIKASKTQDFLNEGHQVRVSVVLKGRETDHKYIAEDTLQQFLDFVPELELTEQPVISGKILSVLLSKTK